MRRFTALLLSLIMVLSLCACGATPGNKDNEPGFTEPPVVTLADGSIVYSKEPFVEYPQTGEYKETALLTNVPGQGVPLLLDMRDDGTIDYIFADNDDLSDFKSCASSGVQYYTIAPDGTATKQDSKWMDELDNYLTITQETDKDPNGKWRLLFTAEEGTILILAQYHNVVQKPSRLYLDNVETTGEILYSTVFKLQSGTLTIIPIEWEADISGKTFRLKNKYFSSIELEDGQIILSRRADMYVCLDDLCVVTYNMDGTVVNAEQVPFSFSDIFSYLDSTGLMVCGPDRPMKTQVPEWTEYYGIYDTFSRLSFADPEDIQYTEDDSLYYLGKRLYSLKTVAYGKDKDFCCWFDEAGQGLLMRYTYAPEGKIEPEIVTVWSLEPIDLIKTAVAQWNHTHATPIFRYETGEAEMEGTHLTQEDILTRLNLELLNNRGPDVLILDGLDVEDYLDFMTPLDRVNTDGVYQSILTRFSAGDDLLALPARTSPYLLGRLTEDTESITSLAQFADMVTAATANYKAPIGSLEGRRAPYYVEDYKQLFQLWYPAWADAIWADGKLNKDVFQEFLTHTKRLSDQYDLNGHNKYHWIEETWDFIQNEAAGNLDFLPHLRDTDGKMRSVQRWTFPYTLAATNHVGLYTYWLYTDEANANQKPIHHYIEPIPGPDGTGVMVPTVITGVRAGGNEAAGQEFVQLLLSRELQLGGGYHSPTLADGYPVMWRYVEELIGETSDYLHQTYAVDNDFQEVLGDLKTVVIDETLYKMALYAAQCCYRDPPAEGVALEQQYTWEVLTVAEATDLLEEMSRIYLAEKR